MNYLGKPPARPITIWVVARHLATYGPAAEGEVKSTLRPERWVTGDGNALNGSLEVGRDLGILVETEEAYPRIALAEDLLNDANTWIHEFEAFCAVVRRRLALQGTKNDNQSDVATAVAWLLSRDWRRPPRLLREDAPPNNCIANSTQETAFWGWCSELGFTSVGTRRADPTRAIRWQLKALGTGRHSARHFLDVLLPAVPVGPSHPMVTWADGAASELEVFSSVGFALKRLECEKQIRLEGGDDAKEKLIFSYPGPTDRKTTVAWVEVL